MPRTERLKRPYTWDKIPVTFDAGFAAMLLGVDRRTILYWARMGDIPAKKVGKFWVFNKHDIMEWPGIATKEEVS